MSNNCDSPYEKAIKNASFLGNHQKEYDDVQRSILSSPLLRRGLSSKKNIYLKTDFSKIGMGGMICQPNDDPQSMKATEEEDARGQSKFDLTLSGLRLLPCSFGSRKCMEREKHYHSYYGEAMAFKFGIIKTNILLHGRPFTGITNCVALKWLMTYNGLNSVIQRLQMELMTWWFTLHHRPNRMTVDANYWSCLNQMMHIDPLLL